MRGYTPSPMSRRVLDMSPDRLSGLAYQDDDNLITTTGQTMPLDDMSAATRAKVERFRKQIIPSFDEDAPFGAAAVSSATPKPKKDKVRKKRKRRARSSSDSD